MSLIRYVIVIVLAGALCLAAGPAGATIQGANMSVSTYIQEVFPVSTTPLSFGTTPLGSAGYYKYATANIYVRAPSGGIYKVGIHAGQHYPAPRRQLQYSIYTAYRIGYDLYKSAYYVTSNEFGDYPMTGWNYPYGSAKTGQVGTGLTQTHTVYGRLIVPSTAFAGYRNVTYSDVVSCAIEY